MRAGAPRPRKAPTVRQDASKRRTRSSSVTSCSQSDIVIDLDGDSSSQVGGCKACTSRDQTSRWAGEVRINVLQDTSPAKAVHRAPLRSKRQAAAAPGAAKRSSPCKQPRSAQQQPAAAAAGPSTQAQARVAATLQDILAEFNCATKDPQIGGAADHSPAGGSAHGLHQHDATFPDGDTAAESPDSPQHVQEPQQQASDPPQMLQQHADGTHATAPASVPDSPQQEQQELPSPEPLTRLRVAEVPATQAQPSLSRLPFSGRAIQDEGAEGPCGGPLPGVGMQEAAGPSGRPHADGAWEQAALHAHRCDMHGSAALAHCDCLVLLHLHALSSSPEMHAAGVLRAIIGDKRTCMHAQAAAHTAARSRRARHGAAAGAGGSCRAAAEAAERHGGAARREQLAPRHWRARHRQDPGRVCTPCVRAVHCRGGCLMCHWTIMTWHSPATSRHAATVRMKACMRASRGWTDPSVG